MRCLRQLEEENKKLKQQVHTRVNAVADLTLDRSMLQEVLRKRYCIGL